MTRSTTDLGHDSWPPPALDPAGPFAAPLAEISWVMFAMGTVVLIGVLAALAVAIAGGQARRHIAGRSIVLIGGLAFPIVVLTALLIYGLVTTNRLLAPPGPDDLRVRVIGEMWWWRAIYFDGDQPLFETANELRIPAGRPVTLELESADVIHSFWAPQLAAKLDMIPGRRNVLRLQADEPGVYRGQCTEYCGAAHALMAFEVIAVSDEEFSAWSAHQARPAALTGEHARGRALFSNVGCAACHTVRGDVEADGATGPDLTHFAGRRTLAAGILINEPQTLRRWITDADELKPGVRMPSYLRLSEPDREAIARYLESLQ